MLSRWVVLATVLACGASGRDPATKAPTPELVAAACRERGMEAIRRAKSCEEAVRQIDGLIVVDPECAPFFKDGQSSLVCPDAGGNP